MDAATYQVLYPFQAGSDGEAPEGGLVNAGGVLYGTTVGGGSTNCSGGCGTIFALNPKGGATVIYSFLGGTDGKNPIGNLINLGGTLYGTTSGAGAGWGTLFALKPPGMLTTIYIFKNGTDGGSPQAGLTRIGGTLFGTTVYGGGSANCSYGCGTVFSFNLKTRAEKILHAFQNYSGTSFDGAFPHAALLNVGGTLFGTTAYGGNGGGTNGYGTIYSVNPKTGAEAVRYAFYGSSDGANPFASLIKLGLLLYGTASAGGTGHGLVFSLDPASSAEAVTYAFAGGSDGADPYLGNLTALGGQLYGTTANGGGATSCGGGCGTVFSLNPKTGAEQILHAFQGNLDAGLPYAGLTNLGGTLYGTTTAGDGSTNCGASGGVNLGCGTAFELKP